DIESGSIVFVHKPELLDILIVAVLLGSLSFLIRHIKRIEEENHGSRHTVRHLNAIITQLSVINRRLQD
ncbi:MAG: hypothetical protein FWC45_04000, partial [Treponema sp.]|nr:hypothetical protein [Treponema sp.]